MWSVKSPFQSIGANIKVFFNWRERVCFMNKQLSSSLLLIQIQYNKTLTNYGVILMNNRLKFLDILYSTGLETKLKHENSSGTVENKGMSSIRTQWRNAASVLHRDDTVLLIGYKFLQQLKKHFLGSF
jgi:hypothetical protein